MTDIENAMKRNLCRLAGLDQTRTAGLDLDKDLTHYGLTSLTMILLITALCDEVGVDMMRLTDRDLYDSKTPRDLVLVLSRNLLEERQHVVDRFA